MRPDFYRNEPEKRKRCAKVEKYSMTHAETNGPIAEAQGRMPAPG